jgi:hypothetical protein
MSDGLPLTEDSIEVVQCEPIPHVVVVGDPLNRLLASLLTDRYCLDPSIDLLRAGQLQHLLHLGPASQMRSTHVASIRRECLGIDRGQVLVWEADHVELAVDLESAEVIGQVELVGRIGAVEDEVEGEFPVVRPTLFVCEDEVFGSELHGIVFLVG